MRKSVFLPVMALVISAPLSALAADFCVLSIADGAESIRRFASLNCSDGSVRYKARFGGVFTSGRKQQEQEAAAILAADRLMEAQGYRRVGDHGHIYRRAEDVGAGSARYCTTTRGVSDRPLPNGWGYDYRISCGDDGATTMLRTRGFDADLAELSAYMAGQGLKYLGSVADEVPAYRVLVFSEE